MKKISQILCCIKLFHGVDGQQAINQDLLSKNDVNILYQNNQKDEAIKENVGLIGFTKPVSGSLIPPVDCYRSKLVCTLKGDERNIAALALSYKNLSIDCVKKFHSTTK